MRLVETLVDLWQENVLIGAAFADEVKHIQNKYKNSDPSVSCLRVYLWRIECGLWPGN